MNTTTERFLNTVVLGYIRRDLERMSREIPIVPNEAGNLNFPIALCVLSYMDWLGSMIEEKKTKDEGLHIGKYLSQFFTDPSRYCSEVLKDIFRRGLSHEYFAKDAGISRDGKEPPMYVRDDGILILDAETFLNDFLNSLSLYKTYLSVSQNEAVFLKNLKVQIENSRRDTERNKTLIDRLPKRIVSHVQTIVETYTTTTSMQSFPISNTTTLPPEMAKDLKIK